MLRGWTATVIGSKLLKGKLLSKKQRGVGRESRASLSERSKEGSSIALSRDSPQVSRRRIRGGIPLGSGNEWSARYAK